MLVSDVVLCCRLGMIVYGLCSSIGDVDVVVRLALFVV